MINGRELSHLDETILSQLSVKTSMIKMESFEVGIATHELVQQHHQRFMFLGASTG